VMQTIDVPERSSAQAPGFPVQGMAGPAKGKTVPGGKTGAEPAGNGSSFLAIIERMIAGNKEGAASAHSAAQPGNAGRGAGDGTVPDVPDIQSTPVGTGKKPKNSSHAKNAATPEEETGVGRAESRLSARGASGKKSASRSTESGPLLSGSETGVAVHSSGTTESAVRFASAGEPDKAEGPEGPDSPDKTTAKGKKTSDSSSDVLLDQVSLQTGMLPASVQFSDKTVRAEKDAHMANSQKPVDAITGKNKKTLVSVRDERSQIVPEVAQESGRENRVEVSSDNTADMTIGFREAGTGFSAGNESSMSRLEHAGRAEQSFASMLSQELRSNAADFVKTGSIILRDNNVGLIRLTLNPESLGNVRISLELSGDRKISGKIQVASQEAYDAFRENLDTFSEAFIEGGFSGAGFDLSWSGQDSADSRNQAAEAAIKAPFYATAIPDVMSVPNPADTQTGGAFQNGRSAINVLV